MDKKNMVDRKKILITGGMGFIGKTLVRKILLDTDYHTTIIDNLSSSFIDKEIEQNERITFFKNDFMNWVPSGREKYSQIYHLASPVGPVGVLKYKGVIGKAIINQLYHVAEMAIDMDAKLMEISTSEVYGKHPDNRKEGQRESINKIVSADTTVRQEYGVSKLLCEIILKNLSRDTNLKYNCVRPFNIVGPKQNDELGFVIPRFLRQAISGQPITIYGNGQQERTLTHVEDCVNGIFLIMESNVTGEIFNIGNPNNILTISDLANKIKENTKSSSEIIFIEPKELFGKDFAEAWNKIPNIEKIVNEIGWEPKWDMDKIISQIVELGEDYLIKK